MITHRWITHHLNRSSIYLYLACCGNRVFWGKPVSASAILSRHFKNDSRPSQEAIALKFTISRSIKAVQFIKTTSDHYHHPRLHLQTTSIIYNGDQHLPAHNYQRRGDQNRLEAATSLPPPLPPLLVRFALCRNHIPRCWRLYHDRHPRPHLQGPLDARLLSIRYGRGHGRADQRLRRRPLLRQEGGAFHGSSCAPRPQLVQLSML